MTLYNAFARDLYNPIERVLVVVLMDQLPGLDAPSSTASFAAITTALAPHRANQ